MGRHYEQKHDHYRRMEAARERQYDAEWAQRTIDELPGREVEVVSLGRCRVLHVALAERKVVVQRIEDEGTDQGYEVPFRAVRL